METPIDQEPQRWIARYVPQLDRDARSELAARITEGAENSFDYVAMMVLAAALASLGLIQGSTAVVIGAMLVAPLMGPLIGAGLALVQGNAALFRGSLRVALLGAVIGLVTAAFFGAINPGFEASSEAEARGTPDLLDLLIALASGMVAAIATSRTNVPSTIAGVAVAAALLPPLAVVGIGLTNSEFILAANASVLFATNLVAIILGAAFVFQLMGVHLSRRGEAMPAWARRATVTLCVATAFLIPPLFLQVLEDRLEGQARPLTYPVVPIVRETIHGYVDSRKEIEVIAIGRNSVEPELGITVLLATSETISTDFETGLIDAIYAARGEDDTKLRIFTLLEAPQVNR
jgi:uncharacterized hydrophobic protein (TIGR00271 family)